MNAVRPLISPADLIRAIAELAPDDPARARDIAVLLGLSPEFAPVDPVPEQAPWQPDPDVPVFASPPSVAQVTAGRAAMARVVPSRLVPLEAARGAATDEGWLLAVEPLTPPSGEPGEVPAAEPLFEPRWTVGIILAALATGVPGRPDLTRAVDVMARGGTLGALPSVPRPSLRRGAQVLIDRGVGMQPFRDDQESFTAALRRALGTERTEVLYFEDCPSRDVGAPGAPDWTAYRPPGGGVPVVLLSDLGLGFADGQARPREWRALLDEVRASGSPCIAFVPYPADHVPRLLSDAALIIPWDRPTTARWVGQHQARLRW
jgi:hypothetical protein